MIRVEDLRAEADKLYALAGSIKNGDERLVVILRALELETEADVIERDGIADQGEHRAS
jgi:hypothetical protein